MKRLIWLPIVLIPVILVLGIGCPGSYDAPPPDTQGTSDTMWWPPPDGNQQWDTSPAPDQPYQWPDGPTPQQDAFQWPDTYSGSPFGCQSDADCFGLTCCPTPWGVKLCTEVCR